MSNFSQQRYQNSRRNTAVTAVEKTKTTAVTAVTRAKQKKINPKVIDMLIEEYSDLTKNGTKDMSGYYSRVIHIIGEQRFRQLASIARADGREGTKPGYFSWLLKNEVGPINAV